MRLMKFPRLPYSISRTEKMFWNLTKHYLWAQFEANWCYPSLFTAWKMRQTEDPFYRNLVHGAHRRSSLWGFTVTRILPGILFNHFLFICLTRDPMIEINVGNDSCFTFRQEMIREEFHGPLTILFQRRLIMLNNAHKISILNKLFLFHQLQKGWRGHAAFSCASSRMQKGPTLRGDIGPIYPCHVVRPHSRPMPLAHFFLFHCWRNIEKKKIFLRIIHWNLLHNGSLDKKPRHTNLRTIHQTLYTWALVKVEKKTAKNDKILIPVLYVTGQSHVWLWNPVKYTEQYTRHWLIW